MLAFAFVLLHHFTASLAIIPNMATDEAALLAFKSHISSDPNNILASNWSSSSPVCSWIGITCSGRHHRVTALDIPSMKLHGTVPPRLGNHLFLVSLDISNNTFPGDLPEELGKSRLPFPITNLEELRMQRNFLHSEIPPEIKDLRYLTFLDLQGYRLTGSIPPSILNMTSLGTLAIIRNRLVGKLPADICNNLPNLEMLLLSSNYLYGLIPPNLEKCSKLQLLKLSGNEFTGTIPRELGEEPVEIGNLQKLQVLGLRRTKLSGTIPAEIFNISGLQIFTMYGNRLSGSLPLDLGLGTPNLKEVYLGSNDLSGRTAYTISNASRLTLLDLGSNKFTGPIPDSLGALDYLREVVIEDNPLDGFLPASIGNFSDSFRMFIARRTKLKGSIPEEIGNLSGLRVLALSHNEFTGFIPEKLRNMQNLQEFYLENNSLSGTILPACLGNVPTLRYLHLAFNRLSSTLPESLWSLQDLLELNASANLLSGRIPPEVGNLKAVTLINLSKNDFSGNIPSTMGGLEKLISLSIEIPKSLEALSYLKNLNISFNKLRGEIPSGGPFANFTSQSFMSNDALCGDYRFNVSSCLIKSTKKSRRALAGLYIILGIGSVFLALVLGYVLLRWQKRKKSSGQTDVSLVKRHERISYHELQQATEGFSESNLLGSGSFSMVYKGILKDGTLLAAKVFNVQLEGAFKRFVTEEYGQDGIVSKNCDVYSFGQRKNILKQRGFVDLLRDDFVEQDRSRVSPDARVNIEDALSTLKKIRHQFVSSCAVTYKKIILLFCLGCSISLGLQFSITCFITPPDLFCDSEIVMK
ncbi:hypothetical protein RND71_019342 [Anisodus tanguticus]|uniref:Leucine-rich repeat-containing N-terminal plant-type domain-containing protein n=1 Tax=Anisodus tanguticus TaxID=243964 RepID=A0AAE1RZ68_9SOLA|nr:hypothetical protein RND71_019342 [Anisodus tanguticus]